MSNYWTRWDPTNKKWEFSLDGAAFADLVENPTVETIKGSSGVITIIGSSRLTWGTTNPNPAIRARHIEGKDVTSDTADTLYLQYSAAGKGVQIGDSGTDHPLTVFGSIDTPGSVIGVLIKGARSDGNYQLQIERTGATDPKVYGLAVSGTAGAPDLLFNDITAAATRMYIETGGKVVFSGDLIRIITSKTPSASNSTGAAGDICWDGSYLYICTATNTWRRIAHQSW